MTWTKMEGIQIILKVKVVQMMMKYMIMLEIAVDYNRQKSETWAEEV